MKLFCLALFSLFAASLSEKAPFSLIKPGRDGAPQVDDLQSALAHYLKVGFTARDKTCSSCWQIFSSYSRLMHNPHHLKMLTPEVLHYICSALSRNISISMEDCVHFWKTSHSKLSVYFAEHMEPSKICPAALGCPSEQDPVLESNFMFEEEDIIICSLCKKWAQAVVKVIVDHATEGKQSLEQRLLKLCNSGPSLIRSLCKKAVGVLVDHIPDIEKQGAAYVCKLLKAC